MVGLVVALGTAVPSPIASPPSRKKMKIIFSFLERAPSMLNGHPDFGHEKGIINPGHYGNYHSFANDFMRDSTSPPIR